MRLGNEHRIRSTLRRRESRKARPHVISDSLPPDVTHCRLRPTHPHLVLIEQESKSTDKTYDESSKSDTTDRGRLELGKAVSNLAYRAFYTLNSVGSG